MIRNLNPSTDLDLYRRVWSWHEALPDWAREALSTYSVTTFEEYMELANGPRVNIGVFDGGTFIAMITVDLVASGVYELHLASARRPSSELLVEAFVNLSKTLFEDLKAKMAVSFTPACYKGILALVRAAGMRQDGVEKLRGASRGRVVHWIRSVITAEDYYQQIKVV